MSTCVELTKEQQEQLEEMAERYHVVIMEDASKVAGCDPGTVKLQGAGFCEVCGGDGFRFDGGDGTYDCGECNGTGGVAHIAAPIYVLPCGLEVLPHAR